MQSLAKTIPYAFVGGILLNFMPCVFPILSLKILSLLNSKKKTLSWWHILRPRCSNQLSYAGVCSHFAEDKR